MLFAKNRCADSDPNEAVLSDGHLDDTFGPETVNDTGCRPPK
jgi:hypothetical protein